jgi:hypothetical protein
MATLNAPTLSDTQYSGDCPLAVAHGKYTLASAQINDKVRLVKLYAGTKLHDLRMVFGNLGASTTISVGYEYVNGEAGGSATALLAATSTSAVGSARGVFAPVTLDYDAYITATLAGGVGSGQLDVQTVFEFKGK